MARDRADQRRLDIVRAAATALGGMPGAWAGAWGVLVLLSVLIAVPVLAPLEGWMGVAHTGVLAVAGLSAWTALTRIAIAGNGAAARRTGLGAGGLQFRRGEVRVACGLVLNLIFLAMIAMALGLVMAAVLGVAGVDVRALEASNWAALGPHWKLVVLAALAVLALAVLTLLIIRLSLFAPASVGRGQTVSLNSMGIAHGAFWPLLAVWLIVGATLCASPLAEAREWIEWPRSRLAAALFLPWLWGPFAANLLAAAYTQLEYWTPGEGKP